VLQVQNKKHSYRRGTARRAMSVLRFCQTRSLAIAEGPHDALCQCWDFVNCCTKSTKSRNKLRACSRCCRCMTLKVTQSIPIQASCQNPSVDGSHNIVLLALLQLCDKVQWFYACSRSVQPADKMSNVGDPVHALLPSIFPVTQDDWKWRYSIGHTSLSNSDL